MRTLCPPLTFSWRLTCAPASSKALSNCVALLTSAHVSAVPCSSSTGGSDSPHSTPCKPRQNRLSCTKQESVATCNLLASYLQRDDDVLTLSTTCTPTAEQAEQAGDRSVMHRLEQVSNASGMLTYGNTLQPTEQTRMAQAEKKRKTCDRSHTS